MTRVLPTLLALVLLALPAAARAQAPQTNAPPGNSAIDEYLETVPGATGNQRPGDPRAGGGGSAGGSLPSGGRARLERLGPDGKVLADAVEATTPSGSPPAGSPKGSAQTRDAQDPSPGGQGRSPVAEVLDAATGQDGGGGMGALLPGILLASLLGVIALVVLRRRSVT
ncbi:MAG: hypothetical protein WKF96_02765 [Solirubrobacteraceae bacterium]